MLSATSFASAAYPALDAADGKPKVVAHPVRLEKDAVELALQVLAPGKTLQAIRIDNLGGVSSRWRSDGKEEGAPLSVSQGDAVLTSGAEAMNLALGDEEALLSLSLKDNGAFAGKATDFRVTVFFADGARAMYALNAGDFPAASAPAPEAQEPATAAVSAPATPGDADALNAKRVEELLRSLPGEVRTASIEVKGDTLTVRGLVASFQNQLDETAMRTELSIDEIVCTGVDFTAADTPGVQRLAANVRVTGYASKSEFTVPGRGRKKGAQNSISQKMRSYSIDGLRGDVMEFHKAMLSDTSSPLRFLQPLQSFSIDAVNVEEISYSFFEGTAAVAQFDIRAGEARDFTLSRSGPAKIKDLSLQAAEQKILHIDEFGVESQDLSSLVTLFLSPVFMEPGREAEISEFLFNNLPKLAYSVEGLHVTGLRTLLPELGDNSLHRMSSTFALSSSEMKLDMSMDDLKLSPKLFAFFGPHGQALAKRYKEGLQQSSWRLQATVSNQPEGGSGALQGAGESNLGKLAYSLKFAYSPGLLDLFTNLQDINVNVQEVELLMDDKGFIDLYILLGMILSGESQLPDAQSLAQLRGALAAPAIRQAVQGKDKTYVAVAEALAQLLAQSGKLTLHLRPASPITLEHILEFRPLEGLEVHHSPPEK